MRARPAKRSSSNPIPTKVRALVRERDGGQCQRCGMAGTEQHHRRSRRARDEHTHDLCNLVLLCHSCHEFVTVNIEQARQEGYAVSIHDPLPENTPVHTFQGWVRMSCDGTVSLDVTPETR